MHVLYCGNNHLTSLPPLPDRARSSGLRTCAGLAAGLVFLACGAATPEPAVAVRFAAASQEHGWHAELWHGRMPNLRERTPSAPPAIDALLDKRLPGFGELMRATSLQFVPTAILSRQSAGIHDRTLVVNLPGRPRSIRQCLDAVFPAIPYCIDLVHTGAENPPRLETNPERLVAFRPKG